MADGAIKSGDYVRVSLNAFAYSNAGNNGVSLGLNNVLFVEEGESLGGGRSPLLKTLVSPKQPPQSATTTGHNTFHKPQNRSGGFFYAC